MIAPEPPRLAVALLRRCLQDNEPLVGDLIEGYSVNRSRYWFWRQALAAIVLHGVRRPEEEHPLGLDPAASLDSVPRKPKDRRPVNLSASPLPSVGGLGLVVLGTLVILFDRAAVLIFVPAIAGGIAFGIALTLIRRRAVMAGRGPVHSMLPGATASETSEGRPRS